MERLENGSFIHRLLLLERRKANIIPSVICGVALVISGLKIYRERDT